MEIDEYVVLNLDYVIYGNAIDIFGIHALKIKNEKIIDVFYKLLKPNKELSTMVQRESKITNEVLKNCPTFEQVKTEFFNFIENQAVVKTNLINIEILNKYGANIKNIIEKTKTYEEIFEQLKAVNA